MIDEFEALSTPEAVSNSTDLLMRKIASDSSLDGINADSDSFLRKTKLFVVAQAYKELNRIIKLTDMLDKLEEQFMDAVNGKLEENPSNLQLITSAMEVCTESLNRSNAIVNQVLKDDRLSSIVINTTNIITPDGGSTTMMSMDSRDAVRNLASSLLAQLGHIDDTQNAIDIPESEVISSDSDESKQ